mmetsp:Transcript_75390/g.133472  ORF Transcript_75390/g.133472 Transcript_75390/m.133472 type:complete len:599 (-) Transcript_75390:67-1863(-)
MTSNPLSPEVIQMALQVGGDPNGGITPLEAGVTERLMLISVANMKCSLALADPSLYDCPLIGCSDGFEVLTGYTKAEIVGRNCRFLNQGQELDPDVREAMRASIRDGTEFIGILPNVRKNGVKFRNFLHMTTITVRGHRYIIGIQADVTDANIDMTNEYHLEDLRAVAERIFSANVDAWVQMQAHEFQVRLPIPYAEIVKNYAPAQYKEAQGKFIKIAGQMVHKKNTFLHVMEATVGEYDAKMKKSSSDPLLTKHSTGVGKEEVQEVPSSDPRGEDSNKDYSTSERDASGDNSGSRGSSSDEACQNYRGELKSVGSVGHPDRCTECSFYFFGTQGCTRGSDCRFCHEFHPRKNSRKNRRILKRLDVSDRSIPEEPSASTRDGANMSTSGTSERSTVTVVSGSADAAGGEAKPEQLGRGAGSSSEGSSASRKARHASSGGYPSSGTTAQAARDASEATAVVSLRYLRHGPDKRQAKLTLAVGQTVNLPAWVEMDGSARKALQNVLSFTVEPPLPHGLTLDPQNGLISGVAAEVQARRLHMVTASTVATGPAGIRLGLVPLARTSLLIRIVELQQLKASWVCEADGDGDERILVEFKASK